MSRRQLLKVVGAVCVTAAPIYETLAAWSPRPPEGERITCAKGCGACCTQPFSVTVAEAIVIAQWLLENASTVRIADVLRDAALRERDLRFTYGTPTFLRERQPCVLFAPEAGADNFRGVCSVYPARPVVCRTYAVTSPPENCQESTRRAPRVFDARAVNAEAPERWRKALGEADAWVFLLLPMAVALRWAFAFLDGDAITEAEYTFWGTRTHQAEALRAATFSTVVGP